jgi:hypothetical protein
MPLLPSAFLVRVAHPCLHVKDMPARSGEELLDLPAECRIESLGAMDGRKEFADVRLAWNEFGLGVRVEVSGKKEPPQGDVKQPRASDGCTLWIDTRDSRGSHRASRYCHQFHLLPVGGGNDLDEPAFVQTKIHRALHDAPLVSESAVRFRGVVLRGGYVVEAYLPAAVLNGFDPEQNRRPGFFYAIRDRELGETTLGLDADFPFSEDPSLWSILQLTGDR